MFGQLRGTKCHHNASCAGVKKNPLHFMTSHCLRPRLAPSVRTRKLSQIEFPLKATLARWEVINREEGSLERQSRRRGSR